MLISQSEADARRACERKHWYMFGEPTSSGNGIEPLTLGPGLSKGNLGHKALEIYYQHRIDGNNHSQSMEPALLHVMQDGSDYSMDLLTILTKYFEWYGDETHTWRPLVVEQEFHYSIPGTDLVFPFKVDGVFRNMDNNRLYVWDHKFVWRYYKPNALKIMPQLPKYVYALRKLGFDIYDAMYNLISTQTTSKEPTRREPLGLWKGPAIHKAQTFFDEQVATMKDIERLKQGEPDDWYASLHRTNSAFNCTNCAFLELCIGDAEGQPGRELTINNFYRPNTYGYGKDEE